jgi:hypothetical protein
MSNASADYYNGSTHDGNLATAMPAITPPRESNKPIRKVISFVTLGYVGPRLIYEIAVYEFKIGREKPLLIAVRSHRGLFSALSGICQ